ncbi:DUF2142 domain-containing protein [Mycetocola sp. 2940]|uniref:DUF2142 domain-containing protein n=1 Tax=Mycetocola sp. 2940 TaxID=3156452 RepID=UPI003395A204
MPSKLGRWRVFVILWVLLTALSAAWSLATPIAASPDEPAHFVKAAAVAHGQVGGEPSALGSVVQVPRFVADTHARACFAFNAETPGSCETETTGDPGDIVDGTTTAGLYNPLYYAAVGWPSLVLEGDAGLYAMRFVSGALSSLFLALAFLLVSAWRRPLLAALGLVAGVTPMMLFLSGSVNPNALEASSTVAVLAAMLSIVLDPRPETLARRCAVLALAASVAVNTRGLALIWVLLAIGLPLLIPGGRVLRDLFSRRSVQVAVAVVAVATALSLLWLFGSSSLFAGLATPDKPSVVPQAGAAPLIGFWLVLSGTFDSGEELVGLFGWLDTPANDSVYFIWAAFTSSLIGAAWVVLRGRPLVVALALVGAVLFVPALIQGAYITGGGLIWQGRYTLPLYLCLMFGLAALVSSFLERPGSGARTPQLNRLALLVLVLWVAAQSLSFATTLRRYAVGVSGTWSDTFVRPLWSAPGGNLVLVFVFTALALATAGYVLAAFRTENRTLADNTSVPAGTPSPGLDVPRAGQVTVAGRAGL